MSLEIEIIPGAYKVKATKEEIKARDLIPFGIPHEFPNCRHHEANVNLNKDDQQERRKNVVRQKAQDYANEMKAPYFEVQIKEDFFPSTNLFGRANPKKSFVCYEGKIQLYVTKPSCECKK